MGIKIVGNKNIESLLDFLRVKKFHIKHEAINKLRVSHHNPAFLKTLQHWIIASNTLGGKSFEIEI